MPKIFCLIVEIFELPNDVDREIIVRNLTQGLQFTLSQYPLVAGVLNMDESTGRLWVATKPDAAVYLHVTRLAEFPSFKELAQRHFPMSALEAHTLLPKSVTEKQLFSPLGSNDDDELPISTFQVNFIDGGMILGIAIHHSCSDAPGCDGFLTTWAESSAAFAAGKPFTPIDESNLDRSRLCVPKPDTARWESLDKKFPVLKDLGGPPPPPADFKMPALASRMWHFPKSSLQRLKVKASVGAGDSWISTYDAVMALVWKTVTRAKVPLLNPDLTRRVTLVHAVNTRSKLEPPLPDRYLGNAVALPRVEPMPIESVLEDGDDDDDDDDDNLPRLAAAVRASINRITPEYMAELPEWVAGLRDRRWIQIDMDSFLGMDLAATSWQGMSAYTKHDFGFGVPQAIRWPNPAFEGYVFVFPSRAGLVGGDEGLEICVCLEKTSADRLMEDELMLEFAEPRV